jgi:hypothetical protein
MDARAVLIPDLPLEKIYPCKTGKGRDMVFLLG